MFSGLGHNYIGHRPPLICMFSGLISRVSTTPSVECGHFFSTGMPTADAEGWDGHKGRPWERSWHMHRQTPFSSMKFVAIRVVLGKIFQILADVGPDLAFRQVPETQVPGWNFVKKTILIGSHGLASYFISC